MWRWTTTPWWSLIAGPFDGNTHSRPGATPFTYIPMTASAISTSPSTIPTETSTTRSGCVGTESPLRWLTSHESSLSGTRAALADCALADRSPFESSIVYERLLLLALDTIHGDDVPALEPIDGDPGEVAWVRLVVAMDRPVRLSARGSG